MAKIVAVRRAWGSRNVEYYKLDDGRVLDAYECAMAIRNNELPGVYYVINALGETVIKDKPDGFVENNITNLPEF